jgi:hypothetical protein
VRHYGERKDALEIGRHLARMQPALAPRLVEIAAPYAEKPSYRDKPYRPLAQQILAEFGGPGGTGSA